MSGFMAHFPYTHTRCYSSNVVARETYKNSEIANRALRRPSSSPPRPGQYFGLWAPLRRRRVPIWLSFCRLLPLPPFPLSKEEGEAGLGINDQKDLFCPSTIVLRSEAGGGVWRDLPKIHIIFQINYVDFKLREKILIYFTRPLFCWKSALPARNRKRIRVSGRAFS